MTPVDNGRYCAACRTAVIDFSTWTDAAIRDYFTEHHGGGFCGRFKTEQVDRITISIPENIFNYKLSSWKKFLIILLLCFGNSFLGIDASLGMTRHFFQGEPVALQNTRSAISSPGTQKHRKKAGRKKRKKSRFTWKNQISTDIKWVTLGYSTTVPAAPAPIPECIVNPQHDSPAKNPGSVSVNEGMPQATADPFTRSNKEKNSPKKNGSTRFPFEAVLISPARSRKPRSVFRKK